MCGDGVGGGGSGWWGGFHLCWCWRRGVVTSLRARCGGGAEVQGRRWQPSPSWQGALVGVVTALLIRVPVSLLVRCGGVRVVSECRDGGGDEANWGWWRMVVGGGRGWKLIRERAHLNR